MSTRKTILGSTLTSIANAIRTKLGVTTTYKPSEMADAILSIESGTDVSDTTATASDVVSGKAFYLANGTKTSGSLTINSAYPSNPSPATFKNGSVYKMTHDGYGIWAYYTYGGSLTGQPLDNGMFYKVNKAGAYMYSGRPYQSECFHWLWNKGYTSACMFTNAAGVQIGDLTTYSQSPITRCVNSELITVTGSGYLYTFTAKKPCKIIMTYDTEYTTMEIPSVGGTATYDFGSWEKGYHYMTILVTALASVGLAKGTFTSTSESTGSVTINCGFQPSYVIAYYIDGNTYAASVQYANGSTTFVTQYGGSVCSSGTLDTIKIVPTSSGFIFTNWSSRIANKTITYVAYQ